MGTKSDLRDDEETLHKLQAAKKVPITGDVAKAFAKKMECVAYLECSSLNQKGIREASRASRIMSILCARHKEPTLNWTYLAPIALLCCSNVFMTFAWYGQLKFPATPLWIVVLVS